MTATLIALLVLAAAIAAGFYLNARARLTRDPTSERVAVEQQTTEVKKEVAADENKIRTAPMGQKIDMARYLRDRGRGVRKPE